MGFHRGLPLGSVCMTPWCHTIYWVIADRFQPPTRKCPSENYFIKHPVNPRKNKDPLSISFLFLLIMILPKILTFSFLRHLPYKAYILFFAFCLPHKAYSLFFAYFMKHPTLCLFRIFPLKHILFPFLFTYLIKHTTLSFFPMVSHFPLKPTSFSIFHMKHTVF